MHHLRHSLIWITLGIVLSAIPCLGGTPSPAGSGTMPDLYPTNLPNITVGPIAYQGPILSDIGMKLIAYEGPHLVDITVEPIQYTHPTVSLVKQPSMKKVNSLSAKPGAMAPVPQLIPGVQPDLKILSPMPGQTVTGSVPLVVEISGWHGIPSVDLNWWWSPPSAAGKWPATPQGMTVVEHLDGKTHITIPRSAFPKSGLWRLEASVRVSDHQRVADEVSFTLAGTLSPASATGTKKMAPTKLAPVSVPNKTPTAPRVPALPTPPTRQSVAPQ